MSVQRQILARLLSIITQTTIYPTKAEVPSEVTAEDFTHEIYKNLIQKKFSIHETAEKPAEEKHYYLGNLFNPGFNYDFRGIDDKGEPKQQGHYKYYRPCGSYRFGLNVQGQYEDDSWLSVTSVENEWPISYSAIHTKAIPEIEEYAKKLNLQNEESIMFSTNHFQLALDQTDVLTDPLDGKRYKILFQNKVNSKTLRKADEIGGSEHFWFVPSQNDFRVYAICLFEM